MKNLLTLLILCLSLKVHAQETVTDNIGYSDQALDNWFTLTNGGWEIPYFSQDATVTIRSGDMYMVVFRTGDSYYAASGTAYNVNTCKYSGPDVTGITITMPIVIGQGYDVRFMAPTAEFITVTRFKAQQTATPPIRN